MAFDPATAKLTQPAPGGFDPSTAKLFAPAQSNWTDNSKPLPSLTRMALNTIPGGYHQDEVPTQPVSAGAGWHQNVVQKGLGNTVGRVLAPIDAGVGMAQGATMNVLGNLYGIGKEVATGNFGHGLAERTSQAFQQTHAYQPQTPQGQQLLGAAGNALDKSGLVGLGPMGIGDDAASLRASFERNAPARAQAGAMAGDATSLAARPIAAVGRPVIGAAKSATRFLTDPEASRGAQGLRGMARGLESEVPAASAKPTQPGQLPDLTPPLADSKMGINEQLRNTLQSKADALGAQRKELGDRLGAIAEQKDAESGRQAQDIASMQNRLAELHAQYEPYRNAAKEVQDRPYPTQLRGSILAQQKELDAALSKARGTAGVTPSESIDRVLKYISQETPKEGSEAARTELGRVAKNLEHVKKNSPNKLSSLIDLRREVSDRAKFGEPMRGADLLGPKQSRNLASLINSELDKHLGDYKALREQYSALLDQQHPFEASFFKDVGKDETGAGDMASRILASPENLAKAKAALGGDATALDTLLAKRVQADLAGKSARDIAQYIKEREPVLKDLPQAQRAALDAQSAQEAREALKSVMDKARTQYAQNMQDYTRTAKLQRQYATDFEKLRNLPTNKLPDATRSILGSMRNDDLISPQRYSEALKRVNEAEKSIKRHALLRGAVKTVGAVGFIRYALHRKMWNIIVGATD